MYLADMIERSVMGAVVDLNAVRPESNTRTPPGDGEAASRERHPSSQPACLHKLSRPIGSSGMRSCECGMTRGMDGRWR